MAKKPEQLFVYGQFENVRLTLEELNRLNVRFGEANAGGKIETLSEYLAAKGDKYKSHYAVILMWARMHGERVEALKDDPVQGTHFCTMCPKPHQWVSKDPTDCASYEMACPEFRSMLTKKRGK